MALSVLMSVYAKETPENLAECLQSLCEQNLVADEVILVEDGPISAALKAVIEQFLDALNIVSVPLAENVGLACALNEGLKHCKHDLVARMDSDDISLPDRFEKQAAFMQHNPDIAASSRVIEEFNEVGHVISKRVLPLVHSEIVGFAKKRSPLSHPIYGYRKIARALADMKITRKQVRRIMHKAGLLAIYPIKRTRIRAKDHKKYPYLLKNMVLWLPNQVWATDITYIKLGKGFVYLVVILDLYSCKRWVLVTRQLELGHFLIR